MSQSNPPIGSPEPPATRWFRRPAAVIGVVIAALVLGVGGTVGVMVLVNNQATPTTTPAPPSPATSRTPEGSPAGLSPSPAPGPGAVSLLAAFKLAEEFSLQCNFETHEVLNSQACAGFGDEGGLLLYYAGMGNGEVTYMSLTNRTFERVATWDAVQNRVIDLMVPAPLRAEVKDLIQKSDESTRRTSEIGDLLVSAKKGESLQISKPGWAPGNLPQPSLGLSFGDVGRALDGLDYICELGEGASDLVCYSTTSGLDIAVGLTDTQLAFLAYGSESEPPADVYTAADPEFAKLARTMPSGSLMVGKAWAEMQGKGVSFHGPYMLHRYDVPLPEGAAFRASLSCWVAAQTEC